MIIPVWLCTRPLASNSHWRGWGLHVDCIGNPSNECQAVRKGTKTGNERGGCTSRRWLHTKISDKLYGAMCARSWATVQECRDRQNKKLPKQRKNQLKPSHRLDLKEISDQLSALIATRRVTSQWSVQRKHCYAKASGHLVRKLTRINCEELAQLETTKSLTLFLIQGVHGHWFTVSPDQYLESNAISIRYTHGDTVVYPLARVDISTGSYTSKVEAVVSDTLPLDVLLGTDIPCLKALINGTDPADSLVVTTWAQAKKLANDRHKLEWQSGVSPNNQCIDTDEFQSWIRELDAELFEAKHTKPVLSRRQKRNDKYAHWKNNSSPNI